MNLTVLYERMEQEIRTERTFGDKQLSPPQVQMYRALKDAIRTGAGVLTPNALRAPRGSGKTMVLMKLAEEFNVPLVVMNHTLARMFQRDYPDVTITSPRELGRGSRFREALVDEGVDLNRIDPNIRILTGINGRNHYNGYY